MLKPMIDISASLRCPEVLPDDPKRLTRSRRRRPWAKRAKSRRSWCPKWSAIRGLPEPTRTGFWRGPDAPQRSDRPYHLCTPRPHRKAHWRRRNCRVPEVVDAVNCAIEVQGRWSSATRVAPGQAHRISDRHPSRHGLIGDVSARLEARRQRLSFQTTLAGQEAVGSSGTALAKLKNIEPMRTRWSARRVKNQIAIRRVCAQTEHSSLFRYNCCRIIARWWYARRPPMKTGANTSLLVMAAVRQSLRRSDQMP